MLNGKDQEAIPQGLIEQARAKDVEPWKLQMLGKQAAAFHANDGSSLTDSVVRAIGDENLGPEHARRVCEFANQAAFQNEWEKGGSVRNIEFRGGPADPSIVLREMNDGARQPAERVISDYDTPPPIKLAADNRVEEEIFKGFTNSDPHPSEIPSGMEDVAKLRDTITGAQDHILSKIATLNMSKVTLLGEMADAVTNEILGGSSLYKVASAWNHFSKDEDIIKEALAVSVDRMRERGISFDLCKTAGEKVSKIPNPEHPVVHKFIEFDKIARELRNLCGAAAVLEDQEQPVNDVLKIAGSTRSAIKGIGAAGKGFLQSGKLISRHMAEAGVKSPLAHTLAKSMPYVATAYGAKKAYESPTGQRVRYKVQEMRARRAMRRAQEGMY